jgi:hypothetical protein
VIAALGAVIVLIWLDPRMMVKEQQGGN